MKRKKKPPSAKPDRRQSGPRRPGPVPLSLKKKTAFSLVATVLAVFFLEILLAILGVRPDKYEMDPHVGFSSSEPLFVERTEPNGRTFLVTATNRLHLFNAQRFSRVKAPDAYRIFSLGGSTTYGRPYDNATSFNGWLQAYLKAMAPDRPWEVINAGGVSYASYRVARLMEELIRYEPDLFVFYSGHNEFLERRIYGKINRVPQALEGMTRLARRSRTATLIRRTVAPFTQSGREEAVVASLLEGEVVTMLDDTTGPSAYTRDLALREQILRHYQFNLERMIDIAGSVGARVIMVLPASNLREASPFKSEHRKTLVESDRRQWKRWYDQARREFAGPSPAQAIASLNEAEAIDDLPALLHYVRGRVLEKLERYPEAKAAYERAREEDVCPLRAPGRIRTILAEVAHRRHVPLIDFEAIQENRSSHGIPGGEVFLDHVHPTIESHRLLALEILKLMEKEGIVQLAWNPSVIENVKRDVLSRIDFRAHALALMNLSKVLGWAGKSAEAYRAATQAVELGPDIASVRYQAGLAARWADRFDEAVTHYRRALAIDPAHAEAHCNLAVLLEKEGELPAAIDHFRLALQYGAPKNAERYRNNLDTVLRQRQDVRDER